MAKFLKGLFQSATKATTRKNVGTDQFGNIYYELTERAGQPPKRMVEYKDPIPDPTAVPRIWWSWMSYRMDHAPTVEEIAAEDRRVSTLAAKVKKLEEADAKLRLQEIANGMHSGDKPDMSVEAMMEQMQRKQR